MEPMTLGSPVGSPPSFPNQPATAFGMSSHSINQNATGGLTNPNLATPGVYVEEKSSFGTSVVPVPTAVPAFIGYTEKALRGTKSLINKPTKITVVAISQPKIVVKIIEGAYIVIPHCSPLCKRKKNEVSNLTLESNLLSRSDLLDCDE